VRRRPRRATRQPTLSDSWIIGEIARLVGMSREEVIATAKADAEYLLLTPEPV
jgi:hypothetical protein